MAIVKSILETKPEARDNDMYLAAIMWYQKCKEKYNAENVSFTDFMHILRNYKQEGLPNFETISRLRRLLQEKYEHLRGAEYSKRQAKQKRVVTELRAMGDKLDAVPNESLLNGQQSLEFNG